MRHGADVGGSIELDHVLDGIERAARRPVAAGLPARGSAYQRQRSGVECVLVDGGVRDLAVVPLDQRQVGADLIRGELDRVEFRVQMHARLRRDRKSVVEGKSVSVRVDLGGRRSIKKKKEEKEKN